VIVETSTEAFFISEIDAGSLDRERDASPDRDDAFIASNRTTLPLNRDTSRADFATAHLAALSRQSTVLVRPSLVHLTARGSAAKDRAEFSAKRDRGAAIRFASTTSFAAPRTERIRKSDSGSSSTASRS